MQRRLSPSLRCAAFLAACLVLPAAVWAQQNNCENGIVRLPTGVNGQITLCPAISAQSPALDKQLADLQKAVAGQQSEMKELLRLVRTVNTVSQNLGTARQTELLQNIYARLQTVSTTAQPSPNTRLDARLDDLNTGFENVQGQMLSVLSDPAIADKATTAMQGPVGDAIARLDFTTAGDQLADIRAQLKAISTQVNEVNDRTKDIATSVDHVRAEQARQATASAQAQLDLRRSLDPLSFASSAQTALLKESTSLIAELSAFSQFWGSDVLAKYAEANKNYIAQPHFTPAAPVQIDRATVTAPIDRQWAADFNSKLQPDVSAMQARLAKLLPKAAEIQPTASGKPQDVLRACFAIDSLAHANTRGGDPAYSALLTDMEGLAKRCSEFRKAWVKAENDAYQQTRQQAAGQLTQPTSRPPHLADFQQTENAEQAAKYKATLLDRLTAWRSQVFADMPDHPDPMDFSAVSTQMDLLKVYSSVANLSRAYQLELTGRLRTPAAAH